MLTQEDIKIGAVLQKGRALVKVIGVRGATTVMVVTHPYPLSSRAEPARGIRLRTLLRDWSLAPGQDAQPKCLRCSECEGEEHHWMDAFSDGRGPHQECKHCPATREYCEGDDDEE